MDPLQSAHRTEKNSASPEREDFFEKEWEACRYSSKPGRLIELPDLDKWLSGFLFWFRFRAVESDAVHAMSFDNDGSGRGGSNLAFERQLLAGFELDRLRTFGP